MALATLSIDLKASLASLETGMNKAVRLAEKDAARMERAFSQVKAIAGGIGGALAAGLSVGAVAGFIKQANDALLAIKDLSEGTGASIENISALEDIVRRTGGTLQDVEPLLVKVNDALRKADGKNEISQALEAVGLNAVELRKLDPAEAVLEIAKAFERYADDGAKARRLTDLLGEQSAKFAGTLKDVAEAGRLNATVTAAQVEEADRFAKSLAALEKLAGDVARVVAGPLVASLNDYGDRIKEILGGDKSDFTLKTEIDQLRLNLDKLKDLRGQGFTVAGYFGSEAEREVEIAKIETQLADALRRFYRLTDGEAGGGRGSMVPMRLGDRDGPSISGKPGRTPRTPAAAPGLFVGPEIPDSLREALRAIEQTDIIKIQALKDQLTELLSIQAGGNATPALAEAITDVSLALDELSAKGLPAVLDPKSDFLRSEKAGYEETDRSLKDIEDKTKKAITAADQLGFTFSSAFEDAIVNGGNLRELLRGIEQDIIRIISRQIITKPLGDAITKLIPTGTDGGVDFGKLLGSIGGFFGGFFADGGYLPPGQWGIAGERGPEPIFGGRTGMTVQSAGSGGMSVVNNFTISGPVSRETQSQIAARTARAVEAASRRYN